MPADQVSRFAQATDLDALRAVTARLERSKDVAAEEIRRAISELEDLRPMPRTLGFLVAFVEEKYILKEDSQMSTASPAGDAASTRIRAFPLDEARAIDFRFPADITREDVDTFVEFLNLWKGRLPSAADQAPDAARKAANPNP